MNTIDDKYATGGALSALGVMGTWIIDNPSEFVTMCVAIIGCAIMVLRFTEERRQKREEHRANMRVLLLTAKKLEDGEG